MKNFILFITLLIGTTSMAQGQGDITFYSNTGDKFFVILNGVRQNKQAETNVKVTGLTNSYYSCKIISGNNNFEIDKNVIVKHDTVVTYRIIEKKGKYKLRFYSETALGTTTAVKDQAIVQYSPVENTNTSNNTNNNSTTNVSSNSNVTGTNTTTTTTTTTSTSSDIIGMNNGTGSESVNMNINISENGMSANVNVTSLEGSDVTTTTTSSSTTGINGGISTEETTTTTSSGGNGTTTYYEETTTTSSSYSSSEGNIYQDDDMTVTMESTNDCYTSDQDVKNLKKQVEDEAFSDDQQRVANMAVKNKCMNVNQIKELVSVFTFSENQLSFLKAAYDNCTDKSNYYQLMDLLTFSTDKEDLEKFINSK